MVRLLLRHWHEHVNDWDKRVELKIVLHIFQIQFLEVFHENQCDGIVFVVANVINEVLINGRLDNDFALIDSFNNIGMLLNTLELILRFDVGHHREHRERSLVCFNHIFVFFSN